MAVFKRYTKILLVYSLNFCFVSSVAASTEKVNQSLDLAAKEIVFMANDWSQSIKDYQIGLLKFLLRDKALGDFSIRVLDRKFNLARDIQEGVATAGHVVGFVSDIRDSFKPYIYMSYHGYLNYLLGIRRCIVRKDSTIDFSEIFTVESLREIRLGQGANWPDSRVYRAYNIKVVEAAGINHLNGMLEKSRFDCFPVSTVEAESFVVNNDSIIAESFYIIYPLLMMLISTDEQLGAYLETKFIEALENGDIQKLLTQYFGESANPPLSSSRAIYLNNPRFSKDKNIEMIKRIKSLH